MTTPGGIGRRLRELREARGLSLSEVARRAGVGKATLSGLETGTRNPTLETLYAVTAQLGVPLSAALEADPGQRVSGAAVTATLLDTFEEPAAVFEVYRLRVAPGARQSSPAHQAGVTEHLTVFAGTLRAGPVDAPVLTGAGEYVSWRADVPHVYEAVGETDVHASLLIRTPRGR
ncbi:helix-turn-helix domain-containing protein [Catenuloplanes atrovinosus]|uniref:Transcriptional regulator with XRE-family HTH domain n=1 Tax=Catenuloplanes atrovinosus TaxID=137266 RepID=A0AAE3YH48_9ACTN|nr:XRE family transcriptional regulator [Catenuloplanes atrovinosus]MDR7273559.1 transcriptional regulator with XRE-family HTH domain [Catenuloplanes atrovinosus]